MSQALTWLATARGDYVIDVVIGGLAVAAMVDSGLVDPAQLVGFELTPALFDQLQEAGLLKELATRTRRDAGGRMSVMQVGKVTAFLARPKTAEAAGPEVELFVARSHEGLPNRVGLAFFHRLVGCRVVWDCSARTWSVCLPLGDLHPVGDKLP